MKAQKTVRGSNQIVGVINIYEALKIMIFSITQVRV